MALISDTHSRSLDRPTIVYGLRGMVYMEIEVRGPEHDLHSGTYGGMVHNPAQALSEIIAATARCQRHITVPGFYDRVRALGDEERAELDKASYSEAELKQETGVPAPGAKPNTGCTSGPASGRPWRSTGWWAAGPARARKPCCPPRPWRR